jgi:hypothetical protein
MSYKRFPLAGDIANDGITTPSNPPSGKFRLYFKSDGELYKLNSTGTETALATGTGDHKIMASGADAGPADYLDGKLVVGSNLTKTIINPGVDEDIEIKLSATVTGTVVRSPLIAIDDTASPYAVLATDEIIKVDATTAAVIVNLEAAATAGSGRRITVKRMDAVIANSITVVPDGTELLEGVNAAWAIVNQYDAISFVCDGTGWIIV